MSSIKLNSGYDMPIIGLGTWQSKAGEVQLAVKAAVAAGYRLIDCAYIYGNEAEVGAALQEIFAEGKVKREDLFIISKLWNTRHHKEDVRPSVQESLKNLHLEYLDLYLIHWPIAFQRGGDVFPKDGEGNLLYDDVHYMEAWAELESCVDDGLIRSIGLSNFNSQQIQEVIDKGRIKPAVLEVECHPYFHQRKLVDFCHERDIAFIAFSSFGSPGRPWAKLDDPVRSILEDETVHKISSRLGKTPAQIILRWLIQRRVVPIPKSVTPARIEQNIQVFDFELSAEDMEAIAALDKNHRFLIPMIERDGKREVRDKDAPYFPFHVEF